MNPKAPAIQTNPLTDEQIDALEAALAKASKLPWEVETEHDPDAEYGSGPDPDRGFDDFIVFDGIGQLLFGTATSDAKCIVEEPYGDEDGYKQAWDETGKANADLIVAAVNALPAILSELRSLREPYEAGRQEGMREGLEEAARVLDRWLAVDTSSVPAGPSTERLEAIICGVVRNLADRIRTHMESRAALATPEAE